MGYISLTASVFCMTMAVIELSRLQNTRQWNLFWNVVLAGANLYFANNYFGWF